MESDHEDGKREDAMCLAVPMKVTEMTEDGLAKCRIGESETYVTASTALLAEPPKPGDYVIVHAGFALRKLEPEDAEETLRLLREMIACVEEDRAKYKGAVPK